MTLVLAALSPLSLVPAACALLTLGALLTLRRREGPWSWERWLVRLALLAALLLAAADLSQRDPESARTRVLVLDRSRSLRAAAREVDRVVAGALLDLGPEERVGIVSFGAEARVVTAPAPVAQVRAQLGELLASAPPDWGSDLAGALRLGASLLPARGGELLVVSDGHDPDALAAASAAIARGAPIHVYGPATPAPAGARLARFEAPPRAAPGQRVPLRAVVAARRPTPFVLHLERRVGRAWSELARHEGRLESAGEAVARFEVRAPRGRLDRQLLLRARVSTPGRDEGPEDDALEARVAVGDTPRALVVGRPLPRLAGRTLEVESARPAELASALRGGLPELIVLSDVSAAALREQVPALDAALRAGVGLVVAGVGGFGPGAYAGSALEALLPVTCGPSQERQRSLAVVVALDASGSMARPVGNGRYFQAVQRGVPWDRLRPEDRVAVVLFNDQAWIQAPWGPFTPALQEALTGAPVEGGTDVGLALAQALELAGRAESEERLILLATDSEEGAPRRHGPRLARAAQALPAGARVALVHIGEGPLASLEVLASLIAGPQVRVLRAADAGSKLRELLEGELVRGRTEVQRGPFALRTSPAARALSLVPPTASQAYVAVRARGGEDARQRGVQVLGTLVDPAAPADEPPPWGVLGRRGLGRVLCLPLPVEECLPLIRAATRTLARPGGGGLTLEVARRGAHLELTVSSESSLPRELRALVLGAREPRALTLIPEGPRRARARCPAAGPEALQVVLLERGAEEGGPGGEGRALAYASVPGRAHDELAHARPAHERLAELAAASGGSVLAGPPRGLPRRTPPGRRPLAPWLAGIAAALLLAELASLTWRARGRVAGMLRA